MAVITRTSGDLIGADVVALVNTVNTVGIMGKGIALQFRQAFPENYTAYRKACDRNEVRVGEMFVYETGSLVNPRYIINFPTKQHWRGNSKLAIIDSGLHSLIEVVRRLDIKSIAVPPLGCGNGGLNWNDVRPRIEAAFEQLPNVDVRLYSPVGAPDADAMQIATRRPRMTHGRAALIRLLELYGSQDYRLTLLEVQKLAYFLQAAGEPMRLTFVKDQYGPYAENLHHVLQRIEGHFTRGYGDRSRTTPVHLLPGATEEASDTLQSHPATAQRLAKVAELIEGFETPYSMELLATVHWAVGETPEAIDDVDEVVRSVQAWSPRKKATFKDDHIRVAWQRLKDTGWLDQANTASDCATATSQSA